MLLLKSYIFLYPRGGSLRGLIVDQQRGEEKRYINIVIVDHIDSGKSTCTNHLI